MVSMTYTDLSGLMACRTFLKDPVVHALLALQRTEARAAVTGFTGRPAGFGPTDDGTGEDDPLSRADVETVASCAALLTAQAEKLGLRGNVVREYLLELLADGDFAVAEAVEQTGTIGASMEKIMAADMTLLWPYMTEPPSTLLGTDLFDHYEPAEPDCCQATRELDDALAASETPEQAARALLEHYVRYGRGLFARFQAFRLDEMARLVGIEHFPVYDWDDLIGYQAQKAALLTNTEDFLDNRGANNVLLAGARGTGKSTAVKALASRFHREGLRLIQLEREQLKWLPSVLEELSQVRSKKFILFLDDLSFDEGEQGYKYLKSAMDGSVTPQPDNVLIYATSNRRHLLKETWRDRSEGLDDVYRDDNTNESVSLTDRFGLVLHYSLPTQADYLAMIARGLQKAGVTLDPETLRVEGTRWEMAHSGRNGRIAHQFVTWYLARHADQNPDPQR
jgi:predicted AAA+ superfamily ATPase